MLRTLSKKQVHVSCEYTGLRGLKVLDGNLCKEAVSEVYVMMLLKSEQFVRPGGFAAPQ